MEIREERHKKSRQQEGSNQPNRMFAGQGSGPTMTAEDWEAAQQPIRVGHLKSVLA